MTSATITDLRVEGLTAPLGLEAPRPRLSWRMEGEHLGLAQSAYRITAATSVGRLASEPDLWDSGRIASSQSLGVPYGGTTLTPRTRVFWRVEAWDEAGEPVRAGQSHWEMGLIDPAEWRAGWLAAETAVDRADREAGFIWAWSEPARRAETRWFRLRLDLTALAEGVVLLGGCDRIDGVFIGEAVSLAQPMDIAFARLPLSEIPLALGAGEHVIAVQVSYDPSAPRPSPSGAFGALVRLSLASGETLRLTTVDGWRMASEAVEGWQAVGFDDSDWTRLSVLERQPHTPWPARPAVEMRRAFTAEPGLAAARLYSTALGAFEAEINGARVGDALLAPEFTDFRARTPYRTYEVTDLIRPGENALGFIVGDGWYASTLAPVSRYPFGEAPRRLSAQLELTYADGRRVAVVTDEQWRIRDSAVLASEIYDGEAFDARRDQPGWSSPGADLASWEAAAPAPAAPGRLTADATPPIRVTEVLEAVSATETQPGVWTFDFGQNLAGVPHLTVNAPAGTRIVMRFAEVLGADGSIDQSNLRLAKATDTYVCKGGGESWRPRFTFHGFRYVEVRGAPAGARPDLKAAAIHNDLPITAQLRSDDPLVQSIWRASLWGQRSNFIGVPTDCPQRDERLGWTGDAMVFWDAASFNMDVESFARRFLGELRIAQQEDGAFPIFAPFAGSQPSRGPSPGWADAGVVLPWTTWRHSGSTAIIDENWDAMARYLAGVRAANPDLVWRNRRGFDFGDWLAVDAKRPGDPTTPKDLAATAVWAHDYRLMAEMAAATGRDAAAAEYAALRDDVATAFRDAFVRADGTIGNGSQTGYILPLRFDLLTPEQRRLAAGHLAAAIRARGGALSTGFIGTPFILDALADNGQEALAMALLTRTEFPSWGYMIAKGATTMWERWNSDTGDVAMNSYNHYAFGAVSSFIMRRLAGIEAAEPGFRRVRVRPLVGARSRQGAGALASAMGPIEVAWALDPAGRFSIDLAIPPNTTAEVHMPGPDGSASVIELGSGRHALTSEAGG